MINKTPYELMTINVNSNRYRGRSRGDGRADFMKDTLEAYGLTDHPKAKRCFEIAWDIGHAYGYHEVLLHFDDLSDLIRDR